MRTGYEDNNEKQINSSNEVNINNGVNNLNSKKNNGKKKMSKAKKITIIVISSIVAILLIIIAILSFFLSSKLSKLNHEDVVDIYSTDVAEETGLSKKELNGIKTIVLMGADGNDDETTNRSDTIMLFTINTNTKAVSIVTVPRDSYVYIPELNAWTKINGAYYHGGAKYLLSTLNYNFGLDLKEYAAIDAINMIDIIDYLGGVELDITKAEMEYINNMQEVKALKYSGHQYKALTRYGHVTLNGDQALTHMRNRADANMDYGREERNRDVMISLMNKLSTRSASDLVNLVDILLPRITTNVNVTDYITVLYSFVANKDEYLKNITSVQVPDTSYCHSEYTWDGVWCLGIDFDMAKKDFMKYVYGIEK